MTLGVTDERRAFLALEWREIVAEDRSVLTHHLLAPQVTETTLFQATADAQTEATRRQAMRGILRHRFEVVVQLSDETESLDLDDVIQVTHDRYGLSAGKLFRIIGIEPDASAHTVTLQLWGPQDPTSLMRLAAPTLSGTGTVT